MLPYDFKDYSEVSLPDNFIRIPNFCLHSFSSRFICSFETSDGVQRSEEAVVNNVGTDQESIAVRGTINWVDLEGLQHSMSFVADENGFQPVGEDIPKQL